jgi:hypothetical protein
MILKHSHNEYCYRQLRLYTRNSHFDAAALGYTLCYSGSTSSRKCATELEQCLRETEYVTLTSHVNANRPRNIPTTAKPGTFIAIVEGYLWSSRDMA